MENLRPQNRGKIRWLLPLGILVGTLLIGYVLVRTGPTASRTPQARVATLVDVQEIRIAEHATRVRVMGTVVPAQEIPVFARVSGELVSVHAEFLPGGTFRAGDVLVQVDPADYNLIVLQREGALAQAQSAYQLEMGQQSVAVREYELLDEAIVEEDRDLVLRKPQLQSAQGAVTSAKAALEDARLDLDRTRVRAPFHGVLRERFANLGSQVSPSAPLVTLTGTDTFWVEASVPVDQLKWIQVPRRVNEEGARVQIYSESAWGQTAFRVGTVVRLRPGLEEQGRMARVLIAVPDPLAFLPENEGKPRLILSSYVRVEIDGKPVQNAASIPRAALRDGNQAWLMGTEGRLEFRDLEVVYRGPGAVYVRGVRDGERLVMTELSAPVDGMPLRIQNVAEMGTTDAGGGAL